MIYKIRNKSQVFSLALILVLLSLSVVMAVTEKYGYDFYPSGAKGLATGYAFVSIADDTTAIYWNPAGLVQQTNYTLVYLLDSQLMVRSGIRSPFKTVYALPAMLGFVIPFKDKYNTTIAISGFSTFQRKNFLAKNRGFVVYQFSPTFSFMPSRRIAVGLNIGYVLAQSIGSSDYANGLGAQLGTLIKLKEALNFGAVFRIPVTLSWDATTKQILPLSYQNGISFGISENAILSFDLEYQGWEFATFTGMSKANIKGLHLFENFHPHLGILFIEQSSGAHARLGLTSSVYIDKDQNENVLFRKQFHLGLGIGALAFSIVKIEAAILDSYLMRFIFPGNEPVETIQITMEYKF